MEYRSEGQQMSQSRTRKPKNPSERVRLFAGTTALRRSLWILACASDIDHVITHVKFCINGFRTFGVLTPPILSFSIIRPMLKAGRHSPLQRRKHRHTLIPNDMPWPIDTCKPWMSQAYALSWKKFITFKILLCACSSRTPHTRRIGYIYRMGILCTVCANKTIF